MIIRKFPLAPNAEAESIIKEAYYSLDSKDWFAVDPDSSIRHGEGRLYIAYENIPIGMLSVVYSGELSEVIAADSSSADMDVAAVIPSCRGRGVMAELMKEAEKDAAGEGIRILLATVHPDNIPSRHTMEKLGYREILHRKMYGGYDRLIMMKRIQ